MFAVSPGATKFEAAGPDTSDTTCTVVTESATANTKGSWVEFFSSTADDSSWLMMRCGRPSGYSPAMWAADIGIGAASSEEVIVPDVGFCFYGYTEDTHTIQLPISIKAGSRVAIRAQSNVTSGAGLEVALHLLRGQNWFMPGTKAETLNFDSSSSQATTASNPTSANTKGGWVILGTPSFDYRWITLALGNENNAYGSPDDGFLCDIAVGASKTLLVENLYVVQQSSGDLKSPHNYSFPLFCPSGQPLYFRHQTSETDATDRVLWPVLTGVN